MEGSIIAPLFTRFPRCDDREAEVTGYFRMFFIAHPELVEEIRNSDTVESIEFRKCVMTVLSGNPISLAEADDEAIVLESRDPKNDFMIFPRIPKKKLIE